MEWSLLEEIWIYKDSWPCQRVNKNKTANWLLDTGLSLKSKYLQCLYDQTIYCIFWQLQSKEND